MSSISIRKLVVRFGEKLAVDHVDLDIASGELFLLLGPSGSGKTTLLRSIAGFHPPDEGSVHFGDEDVTHLPAHRRSTGMVFQSFALFPHLSVADNVAFGLRERKIPKPEIAKQVRAALESVKIAGYAERRIDQLSGGEQQRVALARALVVRPRCLLLDEPLSNLDAKLRHSMRAEIRRICKEFGLTAVYVTHDQKEALAVADRIAVMSQGQVLQVGSPFDIYRRPASRAVASFVGESNLLLAKIVALSSGSARIGTRVGELTAALPSNHSCTVGGDVWVSMRPECFRFVPHEGGVENAMTGDVFETTYLGEIAEHRFRVSQGELRISEQNPSTVERGLPRAAVACIAAADVILLPADADG
ncbi:MAG TPA: ABC transporter ATP-binding protein [Polyangiaceae bacterium]|nr:ABC transporter ATP-binding protein [Polyangiaceae bacterium]